VDRGGLGGEPAAAARGGDPQRQVEVLVVEENALVEAADGLDRKSVV